MCFFSFASYFFLKQGRWRWALFFFLIPSIFSMSISYRLHVRARWEVTMSFMYLHLFSLFFSFHPLVHLFALHCSPSTDFSFFIFSSSIFSVTDDLNLLLLTETMRKKVYKASTATSVSFFWWYWWYVWVSYNVIYWTTKKFVEGRSSGTSYHHHTFLFSRSPKTHHNFEWRAKPVIKSYQRLDPLGFLIEMNKSFNFRPCVHTQYSTGATTPKPGDWVSGDDKGISLLHQPATSTEVIILHNIFLQKQRRKKAGDERT